jgi:Uma2 family endonuclease
VEKSELGRVVGGDAGVITQHNPDTVRGPDVAFYSYLRIPRGSLPEEYWPASPELVIEVRLKSDRWKDILQKVAEYLGANVLTVAVIDPVSQRVHVYSADTENTVLSNKDLLTFPDILPGFEVPVGSLFE